MGMRRGETGRFYLGDCHPDAASAAQSSILVGAEFQVFGPHHGHKFRQIAVELARPSEVEAGTLRYRWFRSDDPASSFSPLAE